MLIITQWIFKQYVTEEEWLILLVRRSQVSEGGSIDIWTGLWKINSRILSEVEGRSILYVRKTEWREAQKPNYNILS